MQHLWVSGRLDKSAIYRQILGRSSHFRKFLIHCDTENVMISNWSFYGYVSLKNRLFFNKNNPLTQRTANLL